MWLDWQISAHSKKCGAFFVCVSLCVLDDELGGEEMVTKADKKKKEKAAAADAKDMTRETKKMQDAERAEKAKLAAEDAADGK